MKITGGTSRGRQLAAIKGLRIRPTSSKVREAIFNILGRDIYGLRVLDLFAGTGILGIEAISRGALACLFVDNSNLSLKIIKKNLELCGLQESGFILKRDILQGFFLEHPLIKAGIDLVFIDPPYGKNLIPPVLKRLTEGNILASSSVVIAESLKNDKVPDSTGKLTLCDSRFYGETKIDIYRGEDLLDE